MVIHQAVEQKEIVKRSMAWRASSCKLSPFKLITIFTTQQDGGKLMPWRVRFIEENQKPRER